jgi:hypothetical protein
LTAFEVRELQEASNSSTAIIDEDTAMTGSTSIANDNLQPAPPIEATSPESECFAIMWARGVDEDSRERSVLDSLAGEGGVISARFTRRNPSMMIVSYDRLQTRTRKILDAVNQLGAQAQIVGC